MNAGWEEQLPPVVGTLPGGSALTRTDPAGSVPADVLILGLYPALVAKRIFEIDGVRMQLPTAVEATSFAPGSASGAELDGHYLEPLGLTRDDAFVTDVMPYYLANTTKSRSGRSMADNIERFEEATGLGTGVERRPRPQDIVKVARSMPGNLERLAAYFEACRPRLVFTLGVEAAAFIRGLSFKDASRDLDELLYSPPIQARFANASFDVVHLVHPHLFIKRNRKWMAAHERWLPAGRELIEALD